MQVEEKTVEPYSRLEHRDVFKSFINMQYEAHALEIYSNSLAMTTSLMEGARNTLNTYDLDHIRLLIGDFNMDEFLVYTVFLPIFHEDEVFKARHDEMFFRYLLYNLST